MSVPSSTFTTDTEAAANSDATTSVPKNYEICPVSGFRQYRVEDRLSRLMERWDGQWVRVESLDPRHPIDDLQQSKVTEKQKGPQFAEASDTFYSSIAPEDL